MWNCLWFFGLAEKFVHFFWQQTFFSNMNRFSSEPAEIALQFYKKIINYSFHGSRDFKHKYNRVLTKKPKIISEKQHTYISTYVTTIWYKNINLPFFKRLKYVKYVKNPIGFAHKNLTRVFFSHQSKKSGLFVTISLACCWRKNGSFVIWSELHFFFFRASAITVSQ